MMDTIAQFSITLALLMIVLWMGAQIVIDFMKFSDKKAKEELAKDNCSGCPESDCDCCPAEEYLEEVGTGSITFTTNCPHCKKRILVVLGQDEHELGATDKIKTCYYCQNELRVVLNGVEVLKPDKESIIQTYHICGEVKEDEKVRER